MISISSIFNDWSAFRVHFHISSGPSHSVPVKWSWPEESGVIQAWIGLDTQSDIDHRAAQHYSMLSTYSVRYHIPLQSYRMSFHHHDHSTQRSCHWRLQHLQQAKQPEWMTTQMYSLWLSHNATVDFSLLMTSVLSHQWGELGFYSGKGWIYSLSEKGLATCNSGGGGEGEEE